MKVINVVGARPNFMKMAPIVEAMRRYPAVFEQCLVHTGQHYDAAMSESFFEELGMPSPDVNLGVGSATHAEQTAKVMLAFEKVCLERKPDLVIVVGDVNSTLACALTAKKLGIDIAHVEAGLRSRDMRMPEEINRLCTDAISDYLFTPDRGADENLKAEGIPEHRIHFVGNIMIDSLLKSLPLAERLPMLQRYGLQKRAYATLTLHRPSNVDNQEILVGILEALREVSRELPIVFPVHPRTRKAIGRFGLSHYLSQEAPVRGIWTTKPLGYLEFLNLNMNARLVLTDSGGLQEETTVLGIPCITLRDNTERPITCTQGTNNVVGTHQEAILRAIRHILDDKTIIRPRPECWDGKAAERIIEILRQAS